ncbi:MAG: hypothetical protein SF052_17920 [Bacteroidia bacterium]|nr:hypothetical protein [Bacteroidia bacterium]
MKFLKALFLVIPIFGYGQLPVINGFTQFTPSSDSRIIYVSSSSGNDATAQFYSPSAPSIGSNPFNPTGVIDAYQTLAAAKTHLRNGYPDWILLKRGDTFTNQSFELLNKSGRNRNEPLLIAAYGMASERPAVLTGANSFLLFINDTASYVSVVGIYAEPHTRSGTDEPVAINILNAPFRHFLVEDCYFNLFEGHLVVQDQTNSEPYNHRNLIVRRNIFTHAYHLGGGGGGVYISRIDWTCNLKLDSRINKS